MFQRKYHEFALFITDEVKGQEGRPDVANFDTIYSMSQLQGHAQCLPEANLATIRSVVCHSQPALSYDHQTHSIDY